MPKAAQKPRQLPSHVSLSKTGVYQYRRRVPDELRDHLGKREIKQSLGRDYAAALKKHAALEASVEKLFRHKPPTRQSNILASLKATLAELNISIADLALDRDKEENRGAAYELMDALEEWRRSGGVPDYVVEGVFKTGQLPVTLEAALDEYREFRKTGQPVADKQLDNRIERHKRWLIKYLGPETVQKRPLRQLRRQAARTAVEGLVKDTGPKTAHRYINDIKAAVNRAILEFDLDMPNPFARLNIKGAQSSRDDRPPLDERDMEKLGPIMDTEDDLGAIWTTLRDTGARPSEVVRLRGCDVDTERRSILIRPYEGNSLKTSNSKREVPIPDIVARILAQRIDQRMPETPLFPQYCRERGNDACSQALMKRLRRAFPDDKKKAVYGLRHRMKDALRNTDCPESLSREILGHSDQSSANNYGRGSSLDLKRRALEKVWEM